MASFIPPKIQDNPNGWGPNDPPEQFKDLPYAPFSKGDRLGKVLYAWMLFSVFVDGQLVAPLAIFRPWV